MPQMKISSWCHPRGSEPGGDGAGPSASKGPAQVTGGSANLEARGRQSRATGEHHQQHQMTALRIAQWNAEGVQRKKQELQIYLKDNKIDIMCIQETHLNEAHRFTIRGYETFRRDRPSKHKGGVLTLIKNNIPAIQTSQTDKADLEFISVKVILPSGELAITNCYSPPDIKLHLHSIPIQEENHIIVGDFNGHSPSWGYPDLDNRGEELEDWMMENKLVLVNQPDDKPSYYSRAWRKTSTPDLAMASEDIQKHTLRTVTDQLGGSDHRPIILEVAKHTQAGQRRKVASWNYKKADWPKYKHLTDQLCSKLDFTDNINHNVKIFTEAILTAAKKSIPRGSRQDYKPYWSDKLDTLHNQLSEARCKMEKNPSLENIQEHNRLKESFKNVKTEEIRKSWHEKTQSLSMEKDTTKLWKLTKMLNEDRVPVPSNTVFEEEGEIYSGKQAANLMATYLQEESTIQIPSGRERTIKARLREETRQQDPNPPQSMATELTLPELEHAIRRLKKKKAPGKDGITNELIKFIGPSAKHLLLKLFNQSWKSGVFPSAWKEAITVPILKKGKSKTSKTSYRPISLLSCFGKTLERIINRRLMWFLESRQLISKEQTAYRKNRSTDDHLVYIAQSIENAFQEKKKVIAIFVDLTKAFDKVWKDALLLKLLNSGIAGNMYSWIRSFLQHRTAKVRLNGHLSGSIKLKNGIPQGGVISPTLFLVMINDIAKDLTQHVPRTLHADDFAAWTAAERTATATTRMQEALNTIQKWANDWCITVNASKTVATCFSLSNTKETFTLSINGKELPQEDTPTYLGVKLDRRLTWNPHIRTIEQRATKKLALMKKLAGTQWGADGKILQQVYTGAVRPVMEYGSTAWATAAKSNTSRLEKIQNSGMRIITGAMKTTPISAMRKTTGLAELETRRDEKIIIHAERLRRLPSHPAHDQLKQPTKNRLKRTSINHIAKRLRGAHSDIIPKHQEDLELLQDAEDWNSNTEELRFNSSVPGIEAKGGHSEGQMKALTLAMLDESYNRKQWTQVFTDGSADAAIRNGGSGVFIHFPDGRTVERAIPAGKLSSNYRAEVTAVHEAAKLLQNENPPPAKVVILTDCKALTQSLQQPDDQLSKATVKELSELRSEAPIAIQWIPAHCGIRGNETADRLAKSGSRQEQPKTQVSFREAKTIIKRTFYHSPENPADPYYNLQRQQQVTIFRLRYGHCRLLQHMCRLGLSHTDSCPCQTAPQTPEHILQDCPLYKEIRQKQWPNSASLEEKLWGNINQLKQTCSFIQKAGLKI